MGNRILQSAAWLIGCTSLGLALFTACTSTESDSKKLRQSLPGVEKDQSEIIRKRQELYKALESATEETPIYLRSKKNLKSEQKD